MANIVLSKTYLQWHEGVTGRRQSILQQAIDVDPISFAIRPHRPEEKEEENKELIC